MKDTFKKIMSLTMLLSFALTTPVSSSLAVASSGDLIAYSADYMNELRGGQPSVVALDSLDGITNKTLPISLSLRDSDVRQVLRMFADKAGMNIIFKGDIKGNVTMDLVNIPLNSAFDMVLNSQDLKYVMKDNTLVIMNNKDFSSVGQNEMAVIPVKYTNAAHVAHFLNYNIFNIKKSGMSANGYALSNPPTNEVIIFGNENDVSIARRIIAQFDKKPVVTSFKVNHSTPAQMADMICKLLLPGTGSNTKGIEPDGDGGDDDVMVGGAADVPTGFAADAGSSADTASKISLGEGVIACGARITNSIKSDMRSSGDDSSFKGMISMAGMGLSVAYYTQLGTISVTGASPQQIEMIKEFIAANDRRQPQAYLEFSIIELNESGSREFNNNWAFMGKHFQITFSGDDGTDVAPMRILGHGYRPTYAAVDGSSRTTLLYSLQMLLKSGKARTISNPRILVTNGQESIIDMSEDYVKTVTSQIVQGTFSNTPTVERTYEIGDDMGMKISVTPFISPDGYLYLNLTPNYATEKDTVLAYNGETQTTEQVATLLRRNNLTLKNIRIKDGDTLILAGMMKENETKTVSKVPFLGDIPGLGTFFRSTSLKKDKTEIVILVTPKIVTDSDAPSTRIESAL